MRNTVVVSGPSYSFWSCFCFFFFAEMQDINLARMCVRACVCVILQGFRSLHLRHSSLSNPSVALPTSQLILQPFRCLTYDPAHLLTLLSLLLHHRLFTYVTWRAACAFHSYENSKWGFYVTVAPRLKIENEPANNSDLDVWLSTPVVHLLSYSSLDPGFAGSIPAGVDWFFQSVKILRMTSFGREVKPWAVDLRHVKEPQAEIRASEQNLSDFSCSL